MTVHLRAGSDVVSWDGTKLGSVDRLVIDPSRDVVTHLVVSKGFFFPTERVVPVDIIHEADADRILLNETVDPDDLPEFEESYYITLEDGAVGEQARATAAAPLIWDYPTYGAGLAMYPVYPPNTVRETTRNVPAGSHVVRTGSSVVTADGEDVGKVREAVVSDDGALVSLEVDPGWFQAEQTIPAHMIRAVEEDQVILAVGARTIRQLESKPRRSG